MYVHASVCVCVCVCVCAGSCQTAAPGLPLATRPGRWSRDPEEERRRQESWQREQERMLQVPTPRPHGVLNSLV